MSINVKKNGELSTFHSPALHCTAYRAKQIIKCVWRGNQHTTNSRVV